MLGEGKMLSSEKINREENLVEKDDSSKDRELDYAKLVIDLQTKLIKALEDDKLELEQRLKQSK